MMKSDRDIRRFLLSVYGVDRGNPDYQKRYHTVTRVTDSLSDTEKRDILNMRNTLHELVNRKKQR